MLQRIQSLYILVSFILGVVSLANPIGRLTSGGERVADLYNLWATTTQTGAHTFTPWVALFVVLLIATVLTFFSIMLFTRRGVQMRTLVLAILLLVGYYGCLIAFVCLRTKGLHFVPSPYAALPFAMLVFDYLAFRGVLKDETLVRSLDRLR